MPDLRADRNFGLLQRSTSSGAHRASCYVAQGELSIRQTRRARKALRSVAVFAALVAVVFGCAYDPSAWVPRDYALKHRHSGSVSVHLARGAPLGSSGELGSEIDQIELEHALRIGLRESGVFEEVSPEPASLYSLRVHLSDLYVLRRGLQTTMGATSRWTLRRSSTGEILLDEGVYAHATADGFDPLRVGDQRAIRRSLEIGIMKLSKLAL